MLQAVVDRLAVASSRLVDFLHIGSLPPLRGCFNDTSNPLVSLDEALQAVANTWQAVGSRQWGSGKVVRRLWAARSGRLALGGSQ